VIRFFSQQCVKKWLAGRLLASSMRLNRYKHSIDLIQLFWIVRAEHPPTVRFAIHIQDAEIHGVRRAGRFSIALPPNLEDARVFDTGLMIEVKRVEHQRLVLSVKDATEGLACVAAAIHIENIGYIVFALPSVREYRDPRLEIVHRP